MSTYYEIQQRRRQGQTLDKPSRPLSQLKPKQKQAERQSNQAAQTTRQTMKYTSIFDKLNSLNNNHLAESPLKLSDLKSMTSMTSYQTQNCQDMNKENNNFQNW